MPHRGPVSGSSRLLALALATLLHACPLSAAAAAAGLPLYLQPQKPGPAGDVYWVLVDGECEGADAALELEFYRWLNTVHIPGELAAPGCRRAWSLKAVLPMTKLASEAGDRGRYLTVYEVQTDDIAAALAARADRIERVRKDAAQGSVARSMKELAVVAYRAVGSLRTRSNTPPATYAHKATPPVAEPGPLPGTRRFLVAVEANVTDAAHAADFNAWYDGVQIPDVLSSPGYRGAVRFERVTADAPGRATYLSFYEVHTDDLDRANQVREERRQREYVIGGHEGGAAYLVGWARAYYEPMGEVIQRPKARTRP